MFATSLLSAVFGMAGGVVLLWLLISLFSVPVAMVLHGIIQLCANGYRCFLLREHIYGAALLPYAAGSLLALGALVALAFVPDRALVLIIVGLVPVVTELLRPLVRLRIEHRPTALAAGAVCTGIQVVGVSGPLLDAFYAHSSLGRHQVVATKALTQSLGHAVRIGYWLVFTGQMALQEIDALLLVGLIVCSVLGTSLGRRMLDLLDDARFGRYTRILVLLLGLGCLGQGLWLLAAEA